jgi:hypothetical protein
MTSHIPDPRKSNASGKGGAQFTKLAGRVKGQNKIPKCSTHHISRLRRELQGQGLALRDTSTRTQCETLLLVLQYLGDRGLNTPEGTGIGFARLATRVWDLEVSGGWLIDTILEDVITADGLKHRGIARYILRVRKAGFIDPQASLDLGEA